MTTRTSRLSLRQLAKQLGVSQPFLSQIRGGKRPLPESLREKLEALNAYHLLITNTDKQVPSLARNGYNEPLSGCNSGVECLLPKQNVVGSNPITRSSYRKNLDVQAWRPLKGAVSLFKTGISDILRHAEIGFHLRMLA